MAIQQVKQASSNSTNIVYIHAKIQTGDAKARITDLDGKVEDIRVALEDLPKFPRLPKKHLLEECSVIYDSEKEEVLAINPWVGVFLAVGTALGPRPDGEDSEPKAVQSAEKMGNDKKPYTTMNFHQIFKILDEQEADGLFYGTTPRLFLQDKFAETSDGLVGHTGTEKSKWTMRLKRFGDAQGLFDEDITWPKDGNVLPILEERMLDNGRQVRLVFEDGFINSISPAGKPKAKVQEVEVDDEPAPVKVKRSEKELKAELGHKEVDQPDVNGTNKSSEYLDNVDEILVDAPKKAKKAAKKVAVDPDDEDL